MFVDTHAHVNNEMFEDIFQYINNAKESKVLKIVNCAENIFNSKEIIELSKEYLGILYSAIGVHPLCCKEIEADYLDQLENLILSEKIVGIGEIGLDYYYSKDNKELQILIFENQLKLAEKYSLPVVIHSREATKDTIEILKKYKVSGVIHCFSGSVETAFEYIKLGYKLGIGGVLTFKNSNLCDVIEKVDISNLVLETDAPFLTPEPFRKYKNESKYIPVIARKISQIKEISLDEVMSITTSNAMSIFDIK